MSTLLLLKALLSLRTSRPRARPGLSALQKNDLVIRHLGLDVRSELACQPDRETAEKLLTTLKKVYSDRRPLNTLTMEFYHCRQGVYETIRRFSHRLNRAFTSLKAGHDRNGASPVPESLRRDQFTAGLSSDGLWLHLVQHRIIRADVGFLDIREFALMLSSEEAEEGPASQAAVSARTALTVATASEPSEISLVPDQLRSPAERTERLETRSQLLPACTEQKDRRRQQRR